MNIDFSTIIKNLDDTPIQEEGKSITLSIVVCNALLASYPDEQGLSGEEKVKRFRLAEIASKGNSNNLSVENIALIKRLVAKAFGPLVVGRVYSILDPEAADEI